ncbi:MAG TPA: hypothetical protein VG939_13450 [Caulobacteraceae bacterium]|nr:hypothetical protein [Caulobacteraceae bacterium]
MSALERAYVLARSGRYADLAQVRAQLDAEGFRAVDALLSSRSTRGHLQAICAAAARTAAPSGPSAPPQPKEHS